MSDLHKQRKIRPTLQDIADRVGVTKMTVSRFIRDSNSVAEKTREKISEIIDELGYIQNRAPTMLSKSSSKVIGIILPSLSNQVFACLVQGIEQVTKDRGYHTLIAHCNYDELEEEKQVAFLLSYQVDGLILTETKHTDRTRQMLKSAGVPIVETMELPKNPIDMVVGLDHIDAAYHAVKKMIASGKRHIMYFGARLDTRTKLRRQGYDKAMIEAGLITRHILTDEHSSFTLGKTLLTEGLKFMPVLDGIFCTNDDIAIGAMMECINKGISIPNDISIVGYNALDIGQAILPRLVSVDTPRFEIGKKSAELLLDALADKRQKDKVVDMGFSMTEGDSL